MTRLCCQKKENLHMATREMAVINDSKTNDVYELRDKKLADAQVSTTPSDITVNSVVPVELEDGSCIKIKRDSLVQAFASVLNSNSQSTITTLFGADSNGNHANINMANLASVLSADTSGNNFLCKTTLNNDYVKIAGYGLELGATRNNNGGLVFTYSKNDNTTEQFSWKGWTDNQNAYTVPPGCTYFGERGQNIPSNYCIVLTLVKGQNGAQIAVDQDGYLWSRKGTTWRKCATV